MSPSRKMTCCLFVFLALNTCISSVYSQKVHIPDKVSAPKAPKAPKLPSDTAVKAKLVKKILNAFKFRKNARAREQERVIAIINQILADSLVVTSRDIQLLNQQLEKTENQHFDSLVSLLSTMGCCGVPPPLKDTPVPAPAEDPGPAADSGSENDINSLVNKMLPILQQKNEQAQSEKAKQEKLKLVRAVYGRPGDQKDTLRLGDSLGVEYTVNLTQKANVTGIHPYQMGDKYLNYNFSALTTFGFLGYSVDGRTGRVRANFKEAQLDAVAAAQAAGCNLQLIISDKNTNNITALLQRDDAQLLLADTLGHVLQQRQANGVTIYFRGVSKQQRQAFTQFISDLHSHLHSFDPKYTVNVVIPAFDKELAYDLQALNTSVTFFLIDFTHASGQTAGPLAPLKGNPSQSIDATVSRYLQRDIPPAKFVLMIPYYGALWKKGAYGSPDGFLDYIPYNEIRKRYDIDTAALYDEAMESAFIEIKDAAGEVKEEIWFDDANTLGPKYDYVLSNDLGGVAIWTLGADDGYSDLWNELVDKFVVTDTVYLDTVRLIAAVPRPLTFWQSVMHELRVYRQLFKNPCSVGMGSYKGDEYFKWAAYFFLALTLLTAVLYVAGIRYKGDGWKLKKKVLILLIAQLNLLVITSAMAIFLNKELPWLGITSGANCNAMPLNTLLGILAIGFAVGLVATRFLLLPLLKRNEVP
ncbi:glycosyl hydrolase family 18 protein [Chitinophaga japonensis]|uniref:Glycosyl hydrolase family 18 (Putative chitinase) n=1 Tax=Chitinophaga japonensis TaxID=104662 RepID=A0A562SV11_CHIJA|nr:glycosyl hydrolase family 18 protein [Chitinophaga japonensis]TWI84536.1 glycosyl hydrolase family 18 (putative chitinase) [Chitinophaga japonensis]